MHGELPDDVALSPNAIGDGIDCLDQLVYIEIFGFGIYVRMVAAAGRTGCFHLDQYGVAVWFFDGIQPITVLGEPLLARGSIQPGAKRPGNRFVYRPIGCRHQSIGRYCNAQSGTDLAIVASMPLRIALLVSMVLRSELAQAHGLAPNKEVDSAFVTAGVLLALVWAIYGIGARRIAPAAGRRLSFRIASLLALTTLLGSTYKGWPSSASLHMAEHLVLMTVVTPLIVWARPLPQWLAATGRNSLCLWLPFIRLSRWPLWMGCLQGLLIWFWHAPKFYNLALASPWWHLAEHTGFVLAAGLFWWSVLRRRAGTALLSVLFTLMHTGMLGALLTFARIPFYNDADDLQDQQLAGLIMWVPGGFAYLIAAGWCGLRLLVDGPQHSRSRLK